MKIEFRIFLLIWLLVGICMTAAASNKSDKLRPKWLTQSLPQSKSGTYIFVRAYGEGVSLSGAKQAAFVSMAQKLEIERGLTVNTDLISTESFVQSQNESETEYRQEIVLSVTEKGRKMDIVCREIDDFWVESNGKYMVNVLYTVSDKNVYGGSYDDDISITTRYGARGLLSLIPSVGQFYKGSSVKGSLILVGEIAAVGGIILCENTRASYIKKMKEQSKYAAEYNSLADKWETGRNISIGAAAVIYVYNLIDALSANGAKRVVVKGRKSQLSLNPYLDDKCVGINIALKF